MNVDELEAGRELDALVAEHVMGYACVCDEKPVDCPIHNKADVYTLRPYSTDVAVARAGITAVLDYLAQPGPRGGFRSGNVVLQKSAWIRHIYETDIYHGAWHCKFTQEYSGKRKQWWDSAGDLPLAICRATLKAVC